MSANSVDIERLLQESIDLVDGMSSRRKELYERVRHLDPVLEEAFRKLPEGTVWNVDPWGLTTSQIYISVYLERLVDFEPAYNVLKDHVEIKFEKSPSTGMNVLRLGKDIVVSLFPRRCRAIQVGETEILIDDIEEEVGRDPWEQSGS